MQDLIKRFSYAKQTDHDRNVADPAAHIDVSKSKSSDTGDRVHADDAQHQTYSGGKQTFQNTLAADTADQHQAHQCEQHVVARRK